jgi:hypothetical protein
MRPRNEPDNGQSQRREDSNIEECCARPSTWGDSVLVGDLVTGEGRGPFNRFAVGLARYARMSVIHLE